MKSPSRLLVVLAASSLALLARSAGAADVPAKSDLLRAVEDSSQAFNAFVAGPTAASTPSMPQTPSGEAGTPQPASVPPPSPDFAPRASVLLRDWRGSFRLAGAPTNAIDDVRPSASNRMILVRIESSTKLSPFTHVGIGEWRIDPVLFPAFPTYSATCGQLAAGFHLETMKHVSVAAEGQYTFLYGSQPWAGDVAMPRILSAIVAVQATF